MVTDLNDLKIEQFSFPVKKDLIISDSGNQLLIIQISGNSVLPEIVMLRSGTINLKRMLRNISKKLFFSLSISLYLVRREATNCGTSVPE